MSGSASRRQAAVLVAADAPLRKPSGLAGAGERIARESLRADGLRAFLTRRLFRYTSVDILAGASGDMRKPAVVLAAARLMTFGAVAVVDGEGGRKRVGTGAVLLALFRAAVEALAAPIVIRRAQVGVDALARRNPSVEAGRPAGSGPKRGLFIALAAGPAPAYGGAVSHFQGVVGGAQDAGIAPVVLTNLPTGGLGGIPAHRPVEARWLRNVDDGPAVMSGLLEPAVRYDGATADGVDFVYERLSAYSTLGLRIAERSEVPMVLEYNGSERWMAETWGGGVRWPSLVTAVERANLHRADLVSVVSAALADVAVRNGAARERIVVIPNGVDPDRFHPEAEPFPEEPLAPVEGRVTIGFAGTFGPWHGVTVLVDAFARLIEDQPPAANRLRLLLIGSGALLGQIRARTEAWPDGAVALAGDVAPEDMPRALASCDILVSPQLPTDGEGGFFGDPIKLYEYMAMGKAVIASDIGRIGQVLEHGVSGLLVPPGDADRLVQAIQGLADDPALCARLGAAARIHVVQECSWRRRGEQLEAALEQLGC